MDDNSKGNKLIPLNSAVAEASCALGAFLGFTSCYLLLKWFTSLNMWIDGILSLPFGIFFAFIAQAVTGYIFGLIFKNYEGQTTNLQEWCLTLLAEMVFIYIYIPFFSSRSPGTFSHHITNHPCELFIIITPFLVTIISISILVRVYIISKKMDEKSDSNS